MCSLDFWFVIWVMNMRYNAGINESCTWAINFYLEVPEIEGNPYKPKRSSGKLLTKERDALFTL
jgi:hypothetical protein